MYKNYTFLPSNNITALFITQETPNGKRSFIAPFCSLVEYEAAKEEANKKEGGVVDLSTIQRRNLFAFIRDIVPLIEAAEREKRTVCCNGKLLIKQPNSERIFGEKAYVPTP